METLSKPFSHAFNNSQSANKTNEAGSVQDELFRDLMKVHRAKFVVNGGCVKEWVIWRQQNSCKVTEYHYE